MKRISHIILALIVVLISNNIKAQVGVFQPGDYKDGIYDKVTNSELIPDLDIQLVAEHSRMADQYDAIQSFIQKIRTQPNSTT